MPSEKQRADELESILLALGPFTHKLETEALPALLKECKLLYTEGRQEEAEALDVRIEQARQEIKANNAILDGIEQELYALRRRLRDREQ